MIGLPQSTSFDRRIPKQKFYEKLTVPPKLKRAFIDQIKTIYWRNKLAAATINLAKGEHVTEIEVIEIALTNRQLDESVLRQIDREIPYHILFLLEYGGEYQAWMAYKEKAESGTNAFKVDAYYHTVWMQESALPLKIEGLNFDKVYENFLRQIGGNALAGKEYSLQEAVERDDRRQQLQKKLAALQTKIRKEKQFNKQVELNEESKKLRKELEALANG